MQNSDSNSNQEINARYVVHLRCTVHSRRFPVLFPFLSWNHGLRALSRLSAYLLYSHGAFLTSCAVTVHSPVQLVPVLIYLLGSSPVCCSVRCCNQGMHRMKWDQGVKWDPYKEFDLIWFGIR